jgi:hypothetical protein
MRARTETYVVCDVRLEPDFYRERATTCALRGGGFLHSRVLSSSEPRNAGASNNTGYGRHELAVGTTVYLNATLAAKPIKLPNP